MPAQMQLVPAEAGQGSAEEQLVPTRMQLVPTRMQLVSARADLVPAEADLVPAEADLVPAETSLVSAGTRPADTARKRTPSAVTEDPGPVLPSEQEAGATALGAEATRPVESAEALTSPRSRAGMPAAVGEEPGEPRGAAPSPPRKRCNVAGRGRLERPAVPGAHQRVPWTAASSETQPGERTRLVQNMSGPLRSKGRAHAQEVPVE